MANFMKRGKKWQARITWRDSDGKLHQKSKSGFDTKQQAKQYAIKLESQKNDGMEILQDPTFYDYYKSWFETYKENSVSDNTKRHYNVVGNLIQKFFKKEKLKKIKHQRYQQFINWYGTDHAPESVKKVRTITRACVKSAVLDGIIFKDFTQNVEMVANKDNEMKVEYLSLSELAKLTNALLDGRRNIYTSRYMILTAIYTGARLSELQALTWKDIDPLHRTISINKAWDNLHGGGFTTTKNESSVRTIRVNQELLNILNELRQNDSTMVFMTHRGEIPSSNAVNKTLRTIMKKNNLEKKDFHFHSLRHSHVAYLLSQGVDLYAISKRLGHSNMMVTGKIYAYLIDEYRAKMDDKIEEKLGKIKG